MGGCASKPRDLDGLSTEASPGELTAATTTPNAATESAAATTTVVESKREEKKALVDEMKPEVPSVSGEAVPKEPGTSEGEKGDVPKEPGTSEGEKRDVPSTVEAPKVTEETATTKMAVAAPATKAEETATTKNEDKVTDETATVASPVTKAEEQPSR